MKPKHYQDRKNVPLIPKESGGNAGVNIPKAPVPQKPQPSQPTPKK